MLTRDGTLTLSARRVRGRDWEIAAHTSGSESLLKYASAHRPSQPRRCASVGSAVCQMSREEKWERLEFGYPTPSTTASRFASQRDFKPVITGLKPSVLSS